MNKLVSLLIGLTLYAGAFAQNSNDCTNSVYEAGKLYEKGDFQGCISGVLPCIDKIKDNTTLIDAYRLLSLAYLGLNDVNKAEDFTSKMLKINPAYSKFSNIDPISFTKLINSFRVQPKVHLGFNYGFNSSSIQLIKSYATYNSPQRYLPSSGFQFGFLAEYNLTPKYQVWLKLNNTGIGISHEIDRAIGWKQNYDEQQRYLGAQSSFIRSFNLNHKIQLFAGVGFGYNYLYQSQVNFVITNLETQSTQQNTTAALDNRIKAQTLASASFGANILLSKGSAFFEVGYQHFFKNTLTDEQRYRDFNFNVENHYVNDDIKIRLVTFNMGLRFPVYYQVIKKHE